MVLVVVEVLYIVVVRIEVLLVLERIELRVLGLEAVAASEVDTASGSAAAFGVDTAFEAVLKVVALELAAVFGAGIVAQMVEIVAQVPVVTLLLRLR